MSRALFSVWSGDPVVLIDAPPGAGKTSLLVDLLVELVTRTDLQIIVATPTRNGAYDVAGRLATELKAATVGAKKQPKVVFRVRGANPPAGAFTTARPSEDRYVTVRTIASCAAAKNPVKCDLMVFDEAYQATFADVSAAADNAAQVVMIGDPGQIGPVVTVKTTMWDQMRAAPHRRAPEVFAGFEDKTLLRLGSSYRLGQETVDAIAPLYDFPFDSKRPDRHLTRRDGTVVPELDHVLVDEAAQTADLPMLRVVATQAAAFVGTSLHQTEPDGTVTVERLRERDVAVVVPHNVQQATVAALLGSMGMDGITVGTADSLQGGQWHAVVALDPLVGHTSLSEHQLAEGRLCVMASRHMSSLVWVTVPDWERRLTAYTEESPTRVANGIAVRRGLTATGGR